MVCPSQCEVSCGLRTNIHFLVLIFQSPSNNKQLVNYFPFKEETEK